MTQADSVHSTPPTNTSPILRPIGRGDQVSPEAETPRSRQTSEIFELLLVGGPLRQDPVLIGDLDDVGGVDVFPLDGRRVQF
jgi:hypothetical protein